MARPSLLVRLPSTASTLALLAACAACSGAAHEDLFGEAPSSAATAATEPTPDAGAPVVEERPTLPLDAGKPVEDAGKPDEETDGCAVEAEPNGSLQQATPFSSCIRGKITGADDVDHVYLVIPNGAREIGWKLDTASRITVRAFRDGSPLSNNADEIEVEPGRLYSFMVRGQGAAAGEWRLEVSY